MRETSKTRALWTEQELALLAKEVIDIGAGSDKVTPNAISFDTRDGDANQITRYVHRTFDCVYSSHCLEHMHDPKAALHEWWKLVGVDGHLFLIVPDEDLYEQGVFPSRFNPDHKATFTISKRSSWSPRSYNLLDLVLSLPHAQLIRIELQDVAYNRELLKHGIRYEHHGRFSKAIVAAYVKENQRRGFRWPWLERWILRNYPVDQTCVSTAVAQIQCIVKRVAE